MEWWCSSSLAPWSWAPRPYLGAVAMVAALAALGVWWSLRGRRTDPLEAARRSTAAAGDTSAAGVDIPGSSTGRTVAFVLGVLGLWAVLDWPLAALGAGYLATAQMIRQVVMIMVVAPLLLFACPPALAVRLVGWGRRLAVLRITARPIFAVPFVAATLVAINAPAVVDRLVPSPVGAFAMDLVWVVAGFVLWMPVQCPHPGVRRLRGAAAMVYLIGQSIVPVLPGFFTTWADNPVYATYELAPRVFAGFDAVTDQQAAAAVLQVGSMVLLWLQVGYRFLSWGNRELEADRAAARTMRGAGPSAA